MKGNVTFVIPIISNKINIKILDYNITKMQEVSSDIIVVTSKHVDIPITYPNVFHIKSKETNKNKLIKEAVEHISTEHTWINDYNVVMSFTKAYVNAQGKQILNPCKEKLFLDRKQSEDFLTGNDLDTTYNKSENKYGKFSYIINTSKLQKYYKYKVMISKGISFFKLNKLAPTTEVTGYILTDRIESKVIPKAPLPIEVIFKTTNQGSQIMSKVKGKGKVEKSGIRATYKGKVKHKELERKLVSGEYPIVHVTNIPPSPNKALRDRTELALSSVEERNTNKVLLLNCGSVKHHREGWLFELLSRDSKTEIENNKDVPYLKDLLDSAYKHCDPNGYILYINSDCGITHTLYNDLLNFKGNIVEYNRKDVEGNPRTLKQLYNNDYSIYHIGVDGIAIKASYYKKIRNELPDVIIGEPHWDTLFSGIFKRKTKVVQESYDLYHPKHDSAWINQPLTPAGQQNYYMLSEALKYGETNLDVIEPVIDTAIIIVNYGTDPLRLDATEKAFKEMIKQELNFKVYFVECLYDGDKSNYSDFIINHNKVEHIMIKGNKNNSDLWQKECLMNIGAEKATEDYIIFVDNDIYSKDLRWFKKIRSKLMQDNSKAVHGYCISEDTKDPRLNFQSLGSQKVLNYSTDLDINPGLCWGITNKFFKKMNGLNPFFIDGGGDSGFVCEYMNTEKNQYDTYLFNFKWFHKITRDIKTKAKMDCVKVDIVHVNHGIYKFRNYNTIRYALDLLKKDIKDFLNVDKNGLLEWKDGKCPERNIMKKRQEMFDNEKVIEIVNNEYK